MPKPITPEFRLPDPSLSSSELLERCRMPRLPGPDRLGAFRMLTKKDGWNEVASEIFREFIQSDDAEMRRYCWFLVASAIIAEKTSELLEDNTTVEFLARIAAHDCENHVVATKSIEKLRSIESR